MFCGLQEVNTVRLSWMRTNKSENSKHFFYSRVLGVVGFRPGTWCFTKIVFNPFKTEAVII